MKGGCRHDGDGSFCQLLPLLSFSDGIVKVIVKHLLRSIP